MKFRFYFFKEHTRTFDRADLYEYLNDNKYIKLDTETRQSEKIAYYDNRDIDLKAEFIFGEKSVVPDIHRISPQFLDLNIRIEFDILYPDYKINKLLNIVETMCKRYSFFVYNETFSDVLPYRRVTMLKAYDGIKQAYKIRHEEEFMQYSKIDSDELERVYHYVENKELLKNNYKEYNAIPLSYEFFRRPGSRKAFIGAKWDGLDPFIIPSNVQIFIYDDGIIRKVIKFEDLLDNVSNSFEVINDGMFGIYMLNPKHIKKIKKHIIKTKYPEIQVNLKKIELESILDI